MKIEKVKTLFPVDRFFYWVQERYKIHLRRGRGEPKPWTDDSILQSNFFTNPYREHDKTTVWFRENVREPWRQDPSVILATVIFRWFNFIPTGEVLKEKGLLGQWSSAKALEVLGDLRENGQKIFTGAYMINSPGGKPKLEAICERIDGVWKERKKLTRWESMRECCKDLERFRGLGGFMAYEVACDLRYTSFLERAEDKLTWCNPGPGCIRGLYWIKGEPPPVRNNASSPPRPEDWRETMEGLLWKARKKLPESMPRFEMREVEHSLCEYDKYSRLLFGTGRSKRRFNGA